jgi:hypothetical protein
MRSVGILANIIVLFIFMLQANGWLVFGLSPISVAWPIYMSAIWIGVLAVDWYSGYKINKMKWIQLAIALFFLTFGMFNAYDIYRLSPLVNMLEHILGSLLAISIVDLLLDYLGAYRQIAGSWLRYLLLIGVANLLVTGNELAELLIYFTINPGVIVSIIDTSLDLTMNIVGFSIYILAARIGKYMPDLNLTKR